MTGDFMCMKPHCVDGCNCYIVCVKKVVSRYDALNQLFKINELLMQHISAMLENCDSIYFYLRRSRQVKARKVLFLLLFVVVGVTTFHTTVS